MTNWISKNKRAIIRAAFLIPIFSVAAISISHVISWYDLANPISWAIYLSIAIEVAAMSAIAASSVKVKGFSVWFVFVIVTLIQFIGNIFFCYSDINVNSKEFKDWVELTSPLFEAMGSDLSDVTSQRRWLALLEGGLLPLISLTCLHFFIKYGDLDDEKKLGESKDTPVTSDKIEETPINTNEVKEEVQVNEEPSASFDTDQYEKKIEEALNSTEVEQKKVVEETSNSDISTEVSTKDAQIDKNKTGSALHPKSRK